MSESEEKVRHKLAKEPTVIVVNQQSSADNRMKAYPSDMQDDSSEAAHKRSKIPDIPSVAAELNKAGTADHIEINKQESSERNTQTPVFTGLSKQPSNMLSSNSHMPEIVKPFETIVLGTMESEPVLKVIPSEPIPLELKPTLSRGSVHSGKRAGEDMSDEEAHSDDVAVLPTREETRLSDWCQLVRIPMSTSVSTRPHSFIDHSATTNDKVTCYVTKKKHISWSDPEYLEIVQLQKSMTDFTTATKAGIHIVISKGSLMESKRKLTISQMDDNDEMMPKSRSDEQFSAHSSSVLREKLGTMYNKIKHYFNRCNESFIEK